MTITSILGGIRSVVTSEGAKSVAAAAGSGLKVVGGVACSAFKLYSLYSLYEAAFSDILCLKTLRHGTDPYAALRINIEGPDHKRGGTGGESRGLIELNGQESPWRASLVRRKEFFVVEDFLDKPSESRLETCWNYICSRMTVKYYARLATVGAIGSCLPLPARIRQVAVIAIKSVFEDSKLALFGLVAPTVKFHVDPSQVVIREFGDATLDEGKITFQRDGKPALKGGELQGALRTKHQFSVLDMGIFGVVKNGLNGGVFSRIKERPGQFMWGVAQLVAAVALTVVLFPGVVPGGVAVSAGFWSGFKLIELLDSSGVINQIAAVALSIPYGIVAVHAFSQM